MTGVHRARVGGSAENNRWFGEADRDVDGSALVSPFPGAHLLECLVVPFRKRSVII